ncbi:centrosome microtubule-binding domain of Cep57-domain-containing protein [Kalaharituber pfeilii]|nr:centrosome microtubule-binding domain of Cep57-domain-containing protein [Kalaharituber pfeilii]
MEKIREIINSKPTTRRKTTTMVATKKVGESATSGLEDNTTNMRNVPARPLSAPPVSDKAPKPKQRRVRKVVYYEEGDTTEVLPQAPKVKTVTIESRASASAAAVGINGEAPAQSSTQARPVGSTSEEHDTFHTARKNSSSNSRNRAMSTPSFEFEHKETNDNTNFPPPPIIPDHIKSVIDPEAEHDPVTCTVCNRRSSLDGSGGVFDMSHFTLEKSHEKGSGYEEANTLRPSRPAGKQLGKVVRGLQDEFVHLKMAYQEKAEEFLSLDPARGKRRRKEITREINDMVAEMDWKCDMIYALYDVAEEVITSRKQHAAASKSTSAAKGKAPVRGVYFQNKDGVDSEDDDFERGLQKELSRSGAKLVDIDGEEASGAGAEGHRNDEDTTATISATMAVGQNEISLLDESNELDDTNMEVARHLARQHKEMEKQLGNGNGSRKQDKVVMDSYDEGDSSF